MSCTYKDHPSNYCVILRLEHIGLTPYLANVLVDSFYDFVFNSLLQDPERTVYLEN